ncbi:MAG: heavy-metal-associated domain-containing protein [Bacteroidota bacterium]
MKPYLISKAPAIMVWALLLFIIPTQAQFSQARLQATGLTCALCSKAIHESLLQLPFVVSVRPELKTSSFLIQFKKGSRIGVRDLRTSVEEAGFFIWALTMELAHTFSDSERIANRFQVYGNSYKFLEKWTDGSTVQVIEKGFLSDKDFKKMAARYPGQMKDSGIVLFLLPVKK